MEREKILKEATVFVQNELKHDSSGHDWWHIQRVVNTAKVIAKEEGADLYICELAALLHDIADEKLNHEESDGINKVRNWLAEHQIATEDTTHVMNIIMSMSFKGGNRPPMRTIEGMVVQDADRLDAIGAIGISRVFAYSGWKQRPIYDPSISPRDTFTHDEYRNGNTTAINHFYEKLLKLKDLMNTRYGRALAEERHQFMEQYLRSFFLEWEGMK